MAMLILEDCISCGKCEPDCPNDAIAPGDSCYVIEAEHCTECVGASTEPTCVGLCPVDGCIVPDPNRVESREVLQLRFESLRAS
jgi:ferredoxin